MDRIYKALELAREQAPVEPESAATADFGFHQKGKPGNPDDPAPISYTSTQILPAKREVMQRNRIMSADCDAVIEASYKLLRTRVLRRLEAKGWKTIGVTSARPGEGKTLTAINLSIAIASDPKYSVLLVDADLRHPAVHTALGLEPKHGLEELLAGVAPLQNVLINPGIERFVILPSCTHMMGSSEQLASNRMGRLVTDLKSRYPSRFVVFDLPPALMADDVVAFSSQLDTVLVVVEDGKTQAEDLKRMIELLDGINLLGTVLNKFSERAPKDSYYYSRQRG